MLSGESSTFPQSRSAKIDKYSTGRGGRQNGPCSRAVCNGSGVVVPMMCGVEHDYVVNTLDKLASIPGFKGQFVQRPVAGQLSRIGGAIVAQNPDLAPARPPRYTNCAKTRARSRASPLITGSVLSRKLAAGAEGLVIDVKWGNGSFIRDP